MEEDENVQDTNNVQALNEVSTNDGLDRDTLEKIDTTDVITYLNTTPRATTKKWDLFGVGTTEYEESYNSNVSEEHWIINKNANKDVDGYGLTSGPEQTCYKGDPVFEFIDDIRYRLKTGKDAETEVLEIDKYKVTDADTTPKYQARVFKVCIGLDSRSREGGAGVKIKYSINYKGDPIFGTVTFTNGKPTFTAE